ncbi:hypothetical protein FRUB_07714 [Fimbriiglobus ruber]|uniref:Uncharacterized protein n=1 Tax=Fimbriiglobus ruber TaxID=1908690 RepID=A0A225DG25_9BACT|nr:hypothetical protein FRUB_07714 [Fimbriiglobus ruber]
MYLHGLLNEAERLLQTLAVEAALILAWAATEAILREAVRRRGVESTRATFAIRELIQTALVASILEWEEFKTLDEGWKLRNAVVHGFRPDALPPSIVRSLINTARRLLPSTPELVAEGQSYLKSVTYGYGLRQTSELLVTVQQTMPLLEEILGLSAAHISAEWDRAEGETGQSVVTLRLSDNWGAVTGTIRPAEFAKRATLRSRLNWLWGDLLEVRNHNQLKSLQPVASQEGP